jgi:hypothetical protein
MRKVKGISNKFRQGLQGQGIDPGKDVFLSEHLHWLALV